MFGGIVLSVILNTVLGWITAFWGWIVAGAVAVLGLLFSPTLRKYTLAAIAISIILGGTYYWGYTSNHNVIVETHPCDAFRKHVVSGPETDKVLLRFKRNGLCK